MATFKSSSNVTIEISMDLSEIEARALIEMTGYGIEQFLEGYYKYLGKHYLKPLEPGIRSLFESIKSELPPHIAKIDKARKSLIE